MKSIWLIRFFQDRRTHPLCAEQSRQARKCFVKLMWIAQGGLEKTELLSSRLDWSGLERNGDNRLLRCKILEMGVQHPEKKIDIVGRLRNFEAALVVFFIRKSNPKSDFFRDQVNRTQAQRELLQKTAQHEEQWLNCFDFMFELEVLAKRFRWLHQLEQARRFSIGPFPKPDRFRAESRTEIFLIERRELAEGMNPPFVQNSQNLLDLSLLATPKLVQSGGGSILPGLG